MPPDRPPGRGRRSGPHASTGRPLTPPSPDREAMPTLAPDCGWCLHAPSSHWEVAEPSGSRRGCGLVGCPCPRLLDLRHRGYLTRAEIGLDPARGQWECPGMFGEHGRWQPCCGGDAG